MAINAQDHPDVNENRVVLKYEVFGDKTEAVELPFVMGVVGDFSGDVDPEQPLPPLKDRKFIEIDRENFDDVMARIKPKLRYTVENPLDPDSKIPVELEFNSMDDFHPDRVVQQIPFAKKLLEARDQLVALNSRAEINENLSDLLETALQDESVMQSLFQELPVEGTDEEAK